MTKVAPLSPAFIDGRDLGRRVLAQMLQAEARDRASAETAAQTDLDVDLDALDAFDDSVQDMAPSKAASHARDPEQVRDMLHALQLCALFDCADDLTGFCEPGTTTQIILPPDLGPRLLALRLPAILQAIDAALGGMLPGLRQVAAIAGRAPQPHETAGRPRSEWDLHEGLRNAIRGHQPVLLLLPPDVDPGPLAEVTCRARLTLPPVDGAMLTDLAAALYPEASEAPALPDDAALAQLPAEVLIGAFGADSAAAAAACLSHAAARLPKPAAKGPTLDHIALPAHLRATLERLARDMARWRAGAVPWPEISASLLLHGPPGTGKTLLAEALAGHLDVPLIATSYAQCQAAGHMGDYLAAMDRAVTEALAQAPSIFFLDEFDSFSRRGTQGRNAEYNRRVVNDLLAQLSRLHASPGVIVIAATNHLNHVDPALVRAGRFDRKITLGPPDRAGHARILHATLGDVALTKEVVDQAARDLTGQTGAVAAAVAREALGRARDADRPLSAADLSAAIALHAPPPAPEELHRRAVHAAGHIVAAAALGLPLPERVTLSEEGCAHVPQPPEVLTHERALNHLTHLLAGRAAERYVFGTPSSLSGLGEGSDLDRATDLVLKLDCHWGLGDAGLLHTPIPRSHRHALPNWLRIKIDGLLREAEDDALTLLRIHGHRLRAISGRLLEERMVEREGVAGLLDVTKERDDQPQGANVVLLQRPS